MSVTTSGKPNLVGSPDPRIPLVAKLLHNKANPQPGNPWGKEANQTKWNKMAMAALKAADSVDPLRANGNAQTTLAPEAPRRGRPPGATTAAATQPAASKRDRTGATTPGKAANGAPKSRTKA